MLTRARALVLAFALVVAFGISACGGGGGGGSDLAADDPATLAPADAPLYVQATLRPKGKAKADVESLAKTVSGFDDPVGQLISELDKSFNNETYLSGKRVSFANDIDPWLGSKAGLFVESFGDDPPVAGIVQTTDTKATQQFIDDTKQKGDRYASYKGVKYGVDGDDGTAYGVVDDFLVVGDVPAFKNAVDVSKGGDSLADQSKFTDALNEAPSGSLADLYLDVEGADKAIRAKDPSSARGFEASVGDTTGKNALLSLVPTADSLELDASTNAQQNVTAGDLSSLIETFPADSFATIGLSDLGETINRVIDQLDKAGVPGVSRATIEQQLSQAGLSLDDLTGALGDLGVFVTGQDRASLQAAAVITTKDPKAAEKLISKLTAITGLAQLSGQSGIEPAPVGQGISIRDPQELGPQPLIVTTEGDRIAIGYGEQATKQALAKDAGSTLADDSSYKEAVSALGGNSVSGYVALPGVFKLADALGSLRDPNYQQARPYLQHLSYLVFGSGKQGDVSTAKAVVGVRR